MASPSRCRNNGYWPFAPLWITLWVNLDQRSIIRKINDLFSPRRIRRTPFFLFQNKWLETAPEGAGEELPFFGPERHSVNKSRPGALFSVTGRRNSGREWALNNRHVPICRCLRQPCLAARLHLSFLADAVHGKVAGRASLRTPRATSHCRAPAARISRL